MKTAAAIALLPLAALAGDLTVDGRTRKNVSVKSSDPKDAAEFSTSKNKSEAIASNAAARKNILQNLKDACEPVSGKLISRKAHGVFLMRNDQSIVYVRGSFKDMPDGSMVNILGLKVGTYAYSSLRGDRIVDHYFTDMNQVMEMLIANSDPEALIEISKPGSTMWNQTGTIPSH